MVIARKIAYNVLISSVSKVLSTVLALVSIGFITRYLGKDGFGDYATVLAFLAFFSAISDLGLYQFSTREISRPKANQNEIMSNAFSMRVTFSLFVLLLASLLVYFLPYTPEVRWGIILVAASFIFSSSYQVLNGVFQKHLAMDRVAIAELLGKTLQLLMVILAIKLRLGFSWIMASLLFNMVLSFALIYFWSKKYLKLSWRFDFSYWKAFLRESYPIGIMAIVVFIYFKMDTILLSMLKSNVEVGIYNVAYKVLENITFFPAMIVGLIFPIIAEAIFVDKMRFRDISNKTFKVFVLLVFPLVIGAVFLSEGVVSLIGGAGFFESASVLRILVFALAAIFFSNFFNAILIAGNLQKKLMYILSFAAIFNVSANLIFIPYFSYLAAAVVSVATEVFVAVAAGILVYRKLDYAPKVSKLGRIFLSGLMMFIFLVIFHGNNFYLVGFFSICIYAFSLWLFGAVEISELSSIISKKGLKDYETIS
ncbi:MAG: flippase [Candidatus Moraniibacteriota bacterium]